MQSWPPAVERVASYLRMAAVDARLEEFMGGTPTAVEAAKAIGCDLSQIVKSLVFVCDAKFVLALVPGDRRADEGRVAAAVGAVSARVASPEEVRRATGFEPGAVAPFPRSEVDRVLIERLLLAHEVVWTGAGSSRHMAAITPADLLRLARAEQADLV
jgi:prolyl-tRNA editing enzyme YbaK/EbsC (Cys-tRNA(Pro) deacylase)